MLSKSNINDRNEALRAIMLVLRTSIEIAKFPREDIIRSLFLYCSSFNYEVIKHWSDTKNGIMEFI